MFHKIKKVEPKDNLIIEVLFENEEKIKYDIKKITNTWKIFRKLEDKEIFKNVKIDSGGHGISWNENIDLSAEEIWKNGTKVK